MRSMKKKTMRGGKMMKVVVLRAKKSRNMRAKIAINCSNIKTSATADVFMFGALGRNRLSLQSKRTIFVVASFLKNGRLRFDSYRGQNSLRSFVPSAGIEPTSTVPKTDALSIKLRGRKFEL